MCACKHGAHTCSIQMVKSNKCKAVSELHLEPSQLKERQLCCSLRQLPLQRCCAATMR